MARSAPIPSLLRSSIALSPATGTYTLATMRDFWSSVMLTSGRYKGNPVAVHLRIEGMEPRLFDRWLELFGETCSDLFDESLAETLRAKALRIAESSKACLVLPAGPTVAKERTLTFTDNCIKCK